MATTVPPPLFPTAAPTARKPRPRRALAAVQQWLESATWTEEAYFALPDSNHIVELSDGKLVIPEMPTREHQRAVTRLSFHLETWNRQRQAGETLVAPYPIRLWPGKIREPDVVFYLAAHRDRLEEQRGGPPDWAAEVLSPSTRRTDSREKLIEYARAGIGAYWVVNPNERWLDVYLLDGERYRKLGRYRPGDDAASRTLTGFTLAVTELFAS